MQLFDGGPEGVCVEWFEEACVADADGDAGVGLDGGIVIDAGLTCCLRDSCCEPPFCQFFDGVPDCGGRCGLLNPPDAGPPRDAGSASRDAMPLADAIPGLDGGDTGDDDGCSVSGATNSSTLWLLAVLMWTRRRRYI